MSRQARETILAFSRQTAMHQLHKCSLVHCANQTHTKSIPITAFVSNLTSVQGTRARSATAPELPLRPARVGIGALQHIALGPRRSQQTKREAPVLRARGRSPDQRAPGRGGFA